LGHAAVPGGSSARGNWKEWNGKFRDHVRGFIKGDKGTLGVLGSPDIYGHQDGNREKSINFVSCHDGCTLNDLVSYYQKHNEANLEENRDGSNDNLSWNCGVEGETEDPAVDEIRIRQVKNLLAVTLLAAGTPMILMGDEVRRTQRGNNNAYCQDNEISWFDWSLLEKHADILRFVQHLTRLRAGLYRERYNHAVSVAELLAHARIEWHGVKLDEPGWGEDSHSIALTVKGDRHGKLFHFMVNSYWEFQLPPTPAGNPWRRLIDTSLPSPCDIMESRCAPPVGNCICRVNARSMAMLHSAMGRPVRRQKSKRVGKRTPRACR
jgi:isoamylase